MADPVTTTPCWFCAAAPGAGGVPGTPPPPGPPPTRCAMGPTVKGSRWRNVAARCSGDWAWPAGGAPNPPGTAGPPGAPAVMSTGTGAPRPTLLKPGSATCWLLTVPTQTMLAATAVHTSFFAIRILTPPSNLRSGPTRTDEGIVAPARSRRFDIDKAGAHKEITQVRQAVLTPLGADQH